MAGNLYTHRLQTPVRDTNASLPDELNAFYIRFELTNKYSPTASQQIMPVVSANDVRKSFHWNNIQKADGLDRVSGYILKTCSDQIGAVFLHIFLCVSKQFNNTDLFKNYCAVALTRITIKCFERLVLRHIKSHIAETLDPLQFAYWQNRSTEDAISFSLHTTLAYLENRSCYARFKFMDDISVFNTVISTKLTQATGFRTQSHPMQQDVHADRHEHLLLFDYQ